MTRKSTDLKIINDMHPAMIVASLRIAGTSLSELSRNNGLKSNSLRNVFYRPWPKAERIVANALDKNPVDIWPSRYPEVR